MPELIPVTSGHIKAIGYDPEKHELHVVFNGTPEPYIYESVPQALYDDLMDAPSIGSYFAKNIRNAFLFRVQKEDT